MHKPPHAGERVWERPALPHASTFQAASTFSGVRQGFVFKSGPQGLGYYVDDKGASARRYAREFQSDRSLRFWCV